MDDPEGARTDEHTRDNPQVLNIERSFIEEHLAQCCSFIMEWSTKRPPPNNEALLAQVQRIDLKIRTKWTDMYRAIMPNDITFTLCIRKAKATADNMWG